MPARLCLLLAALLFLAACGGGTDEPEAAAEPEAGAEAPTGDPAGGPAGEMPTVTAEAETGETVASHCRAGEEVVFTCAVGERVLSICASPGLTRTEGYLQYRFGAPGDVKLAFPDTLAGAQDRFVWQTIGYAGGWDTRLRFENAPHTYEVYDKSFKASMTERDVQAGVTVFRNGAEFALLRCDLPVAGSLNSLYEVVPEGEFFE